MIAIVIVEQKPRDPAIREQKDNTVCPCAADGGKVLAREQLSCGD